MKTINFFTLIIALSCFTAIHAQANLELRLEESSSTLLAGDTAMFTLILENTDTVDATDVSVNLTLQDDLTIIEGATSLTVAMLAAGATDTLTFTATSTGYATFIAEVTTDDDLLSSRCIDFNTCCGNNFGYYVDCSQESDEVLYPLERFEVELVAINCFPTGDIGCGAKYDITVANTSNIASAPLNLFMRAFVPDGAPFYIQAGPTLEFPSVPANDSLTFTADFGNCVRPPNQFSTLGGLDIGLTQNDNISLFAVGRVPFSLEELEASSGVEYCAYNNQTDIEILVESNGIIREDDNTAEYKVFVTNIGGETAESIQITYGRAESAGPGATPFIAYNGSSDYPGSSLSEDGESRIRGVNYDVYWNIRDLAPGDTAILNATASVLDFIDQFRTNVFVNQNSFLEDTDPSNNQESIFFQRATVDLELTMEAPVFPFPQYIPNSVTLTLKNEGSETATGIEVALDLSDRSQAVLVGDFQPITSRGRFNRFFNLWQIDTLPPFTEATLEVQYFPLVENYIPFAQVTAANQEDLDSTPGNGTCCVASEDDEAVLSTVNLVGATTQLDSNTYRLTPAINSQIGALWSNSRIDIVEDFFLEAELFLGNNDNGADGIAFVLQPLCNDIIGNSALGEFIGYGGITPSLIVEFDTYQNEFDPFSDHVAVLQNGEGNHLRDNSIIDPIEVNNLEDGMFHTVTIQWVASTQTFTVSLDDQVLFDEVIGTIVADIFSNDSLVYWGFTAATGGLNNEQIVRIVNVEANESLGQECADNQLNLESRSTISKNDFKLYPNPTTGRLNLQGLNGESVPYRIFDLLGKVVQQGQLSDNQINVGKIASGTYFLNIEGTTLRFVKL